MFKIGSADSCHRTLEQIDLSSEGTSSTNKSASISSDSFVPIARTGTYQGARVSLIDSFERIKKTLNLTDSDHILSLICQYFDKQSSFANENKVEFQKFLFDEQKAYKWGNKITEFLDVVQLIASMQTLSTVETKVLENDIALIDGFRKTLNADMQIVHPQFSALGASNLMNRFTGKGITVAVLDVFDDDLMILQKNSHTRANMQPMMKFGNPVSLNHGNCVIDVLLQIAPEITVIPIAFDNKSYSEVLQYLLTRDDISIVNLSRPLMETKGMLDPSFAKGMLALVQQKIVCKSLGNSGTDLEDKKTLAMMQAPQGASGDLSGYDTRLIASFLHRITSDEVNNDKFLLAQNLSLYATDTALSATVPGDNVQAQQRCLGAPADGVFCASTDNFEAGSSFAAPQLSALSALLMQAAKALQNKDKDELGLVVSALKSAAHGDQNQRTAKGLGIAQGDLALTQIEHGIF